MFYYFILHLKVAGWYIIVKNLKGKNADSKFILICFFFFQLIFSNIIIEKHWNLKTIIFFADLFELKKIIRTNIRGLRKKNNSRGFLEA